MIVQIPWTERRFQFNFPVGMFPVILERLRGTPLRLAGMLAGFGDEVLSSKPGGKWSVKEQVGHLCDLEELWSTRIDDFLQGKSVLTAADMSNARTNQAGHNETPVGELLERFAELRQALLQKLASADSETVARNALHPRLQQPMRLVDSLFFAAEHDDHHLAKIRELLGPEAAS